jgi:hypothetical protein
LPSSHQIGQNSISIPASIPGIPSFIWPEPLPHLKTWIYPFPNSTTVNATLPGWTNSSVVGEQFSSQINDTRNNTDTGVGVATASKSLQSGICITDHSDTVFMVISSCTFIFIGWHFILLFFYPTIHRYVWEGNKHITKVKVEDDDNDDDIDDDDDDENANTVPMLELERVPAEDLA